MTLAIFRRSNVADNITIPVMNRDLPQSGMVPVRPVKLTGNQNRRHHPVDTARRSRNPTCLGECEVERLMSKQVVKRIKEYVVAGRLQKNREDLISIPVFYYLLFISFSIDFITPL